MPTPFLCPSCGSESVNPPENRAPSYGCPKCGKTILCGNHPQAKEVSAPVTGFGRTTGLLNRVPRPYLIAGGVLFALVVFFALMSCVLGWMLLSSGRTARRSEPVTPEERAAVKEVRDLHAAWDVFEVEKIGPHLLNVGWPPAADQHDVVVFTSEHDHRKTASMIRVRAFAAMSDTGRVDHPDMVVVVFPDGRPPHTFDVGGDDWTAPYLAYRRSSGKTPR